MKMFKLFSTFILAAGVEDGTKSESGRASRSSMDFCFNRTE